MTKEQFEIFWEANYPNTFPISHFFRNNFPERWLSIDSFPDAKIYPDNQEELEVLLLRQNEIIDDLFGDNSEILIVIGEFYFEDQVPFDELESYYSLTNISIGALDPIDLNILWPGDYDKGIFFIVRFCKQIWIPNQFNKLLKDIAEYYLRAFFVSIEKKYIIAPYEGGMDIIFNNTETRDSYREKYKL